MKKIKIFLGSSIKEFKIERMELENFIYKTSREIFEKNYNIQIEPLLCENLDNHLRRGGTQNTINEKYVLESDMCFFIFFTRAGEFTQQEFEAAFEKFRKDGKPKIYIYFKNLQDGEKAEDSVREFMEKIDNELSHYHGTFDHIDTIKLRILLNLKLQEMDFVSVEFENGKCVVDGKNAFDISNVSEFANNALLQQLQMELAEIEEEYLQMKPIYVKSGASESFCRKYAETASKRQNLIDTIEELQKNIFNMSLRICKDEVHGEITVRQKEAYRLFELGDYEGCMSVLDAEEIDNDFFAFEKQEEQKLKKRAGIYIREHKTAIDILMTMVNYKNRFNEIEERYEKIIKVAEKYLVELDVVYDYASYLFVQNKLNRALTIAKKLQLIYDNNLDIHEEHNKSALFCLLGNICNSISSKYKLAEKYYLKAINIAEKLAEENPDKYIADLARYYDCAGLYYEDHINKEKAENYFNKAVDIFEALAKENPDKYDHDLLKSYNNIACYFRCQNNGKKAEYYYEKALSIVKKLEEENLDKDYYGFAIIYDNVGSFLEEQENKVKAENYHNKALKILEKLALENPNEHSADLALCYYSFGLFYKRNGNIKKAEYFLNQAIALQENLAKENPEKFNHGLAISYDYLAVLYKQNNRKNAEDLYLKALDIWKYMVELDPEKYIPDLSICYNNLGMFYSDVDLVKSTIYYIKAIETSEKIVLKNPERFNPHLAITYYNFSKFNNQYLEKAYQIAKNYPDNIYCKQIIDYVESN